MPTTYMTIANSAWPLIANINTTVGGGLQPATAYLNHLAPQIARHFPAHHLDTVAIRVSTPVPAPNLTALETALGYPACPATISPHDFPVAAKCQLAANCNFGNHNGACTCGIGHAHVFDVLCAFTNAAAVAQLSGVTYRNVIYLTAGAQNNLPTIVHELVHTLQWRRFGAHRFLELYIRGWAENWTNTPLNQFNYFANPAEVRTVHYQNMVPNLPNVAALRNGTAPVPVALTTLVNFGVTETTATIGM